MSEVKVNKISPRTNCGTTQLGDAGDTITVTGDLKSNSLKSASGSTITLGQSGDTIQLGCGASQTGFGRTGTVNWDTTAKTASFTAVSGNGYFVNTTSAAITLTLPASPSAGDIVSVKDYAGTFETNNLTIARNGSNLDGSAADSVRDTNNESLSLVYVDGTQGWKSVEEGTGYIGENFMVATGGTITCCGDYKIHTFTSPGTFTVSSLSSSPTNNSVDYLVVAGGGAGGFGVSNYQGGGGGGAGGYRESSGAASGCYTTSPLGACVSALPVSATAYPITVGAGGATTTQPANSKNPGSNSVFSTITSTGGGGGGNYPSDNGNGNNGGSGGGGGSQNTPSPGSSALGGTGNTPPTTPAQGTDGGDGNIVSYGPGNPHNGGGGGGATVTGVDATGPQAGPGGTGATSSINGTPTERGGGGGGGSQENSAGTASGGGAAGGTNAPGSAGTVNTGGGGGGGGQQLGGPDKNGGAGGSGIVIIRYKYQ